jgi:hypothetical protein
MQADSFCIRLHAASAVLGATLFGTNTWANVN